MGILKFMDNMIFPINFNSYQTEYGWVDIPWVLRDIWIRVKPKGQQWYALYGTLNAGPVLEITVHDMWDNFRGGIGDEVYKTTVSEFTAEELVKINNCIEKKKNLLAEEEYFKREDAKRLEAINKVYKEMFP